MSAENLVYIGPMRRACEVQIQCETPKPGFVLGFSIDHDTYCPEEGCESPGHFPVAVVEYEDGRLSSVPVRFIRMTDQIETK